MEIRQMWRLARWFYLSLLLISISWSSHGQQNSFSAGSDFVTTNYQVHVSVGQVFGSFQYTTPQVEEGVLAALIELLVLATNPPSERRFGIFPNPFTDVIQLTSNISSVAQLVEVEVYSMTGVQVDSRYLYESTSQMSLAHLKAGTYLVRIRVPGQEDYIQKIVKAN